MTAALLRAASTVPATLSHGMADARAVHTVPGAARVQVARLDAGRLRAVIDAAMQQARLGNALASPLRCQALALLAEFSVLTVGDIATLTESTLALSSYHLHQLAAVGLVSIARCGREHHVRLRSREVAQALRALSLLAAAMAPAGASQTR